MIKIVLQCNSRSLIAINIKSSVMTKLDWLHRCAASKTSDDNWDRYRITECRLSQSHLDVVFVLALFAAHRRRSSDFHGLLRRQLLPGGRRGHQGQQGHEAGRPHPPNGSDDDGSSIKAYLFENRFWTLNLVAWQDPSSSGEFKIKFGYYMKQCP